MSLTLAEPIFPAIQGEGDRAGYPSVFIRLAGCNFTCSGFGCKEVSPLDNETIITGCDSIHSVNAKHFKHTWEKLTGNEVVNQMNELMKNQLGFGNPYAEAPDIVISGGEPMIHHTNEDLHFVINYYSSRGHKVYVETNGTQKVDFEKYPVWKKVVFTLSVKMKNSGESIEDRFKPDVVTDYLQNTNGSTFKFVLDKTLEAKDELEAFLKTVAIFAPVYLMPQGGTIAEIEESAKPVYEYAMSQGYRYSDRLHIRVWNDLRGV